MAMTLLVLSLSVVYCGVAAGQQDKASFSCLIDGQSFSSKGSDGVVNAVIKTAPDILNIGLVSMDPKYKDTDPPQIALVFSPVGTTTIKGNTGKYTAKYSAASKLDNDYVGVAVLVTVTSITASRVTGTFSGKFSSASKTISITDGQFDVPVSRYSQPLK
jgi:hypothetical protein